MEGLGVSQPSEYIKKPILNYINYFRAFAILFIVLGHSVCWGRYDMLLTNVYIFPGGTFYFIFIAGYLFQYLSYKYNYKTYINNKFFNVILPYLITILPFAIIFANTNFDKSSIFYNIPSTIKFLICFPFGTIINPPLWFMGMISLFFIFAPIFIHLKNHKKLFITIMVTGLIFITFTERPGVVTIESLQKYKTENLYFLLPILKLYVKSFFYFTPIYMSGMFLCDFIENKPNFIFKYKKIILSFLIFLFIFNYFLFVFLTHFEYGQWTFVRIVSCLLIFVILYIYENKITKNFLLNKCLNLIANYSFGIFFIHQYFINCMFHGSLFSLKNELIVEIHRNTLKCCLYCWLTFFITIIGSIFTLWLIKVMLNKLKIEKTRRFIGV